ncbi:hypothetical protein ACN9OL_00695, partial [Glaesserella parasuis]|uniref:hypothetical protein n=1 Tax=Glaesserella parasuis TaxID=738 RepID=UPI003B66DB2C
FGFADEVIHAYATERVLALGTPKLWITLWFMLLVYYNFNIQGDITTILLLLVTVVLLGMVVLLLVV